MEIQKKMLALSNLLQIGDLISASTDIDNVLEVVLEKLSQFYDNAFALAYLSERKTDEFKLRSSINLRDNGLLSLTVKAGEEFLGRIAHKNKIITIDSTTPRNSEGFKFKNMYKLTNAVIAPIFSGKICRGLLILGNDIKEFTYTNEDIDTIKVFMWQLSIAVESDILLKKAEMLAIKDDLTDAFNKNYIMPRLNEEIKRAMLYQRPCAFIVIDIDKFTDYRNKKGQLASEVALKKIADSLKPLLGPIDKAARIGDDQFALLLPEKNKKAAYEIAEKIRESISKIELSDDPSDRLTVSVGVSENPLDGATSDELLKKAILFVKRAKEDGMNKVVT